MIKVKASWSKVVPDGFRLIWNLRVPYISGPVFYVNVEIRCLWWSVRVSFKVE
jgi:hypothetical protein